MCSRKVPRKQVSIPLRYAKNYIGQFVNSCREVVSIPLRYAKNRYLCIHRARPTLVSIPLRYAKNDDISAEAINALDSFNSS